jgi:hypothetical protein
LPTDGCCGEARLGVDPDPEIWEREPRRGAADHCICPSKTDGDASRARCLQRACGDVIENTIKFVLFSHRFLSGCEERHGGWVVRNVGLYSWSRHL